LEVLGRVVRVLKDWSMESEEALSGIMARANKRDCWLGKVSSKMFRVLLQME
jgi:hypothetical protein